MTVVRTGKDGQSDPMMRIDEFAKSLLNTKKKQELYSSHSSSNWTVWWQLTHLHTAINCHQPDTPVWEIWTHPDTVFAVYIEDQPDTPWLRDMDSPITLFAAYIEDQPDTPWLRDTDSSITVFAARPVTWNVDWPICKNSSQHVTRCNQF